MIGQLGATAPAMREMARTSPATDNAAAAAEAQPEGDSYGIVEGD